MRGQKAISDLRVAWRHAEGLPWRMQEFAKPQAAIVRRLSEEAAPAQLQEMVSRHMCRLEAFLPQAEVLSNRLREVFRSAPFAVALASLKMFCNSLPTSAWVHSLAAEVTTQWGGETTPATTCSGRRRAGWLQGWQGSHPWLLSHPLSCLRVPLSGIGRGQNFGFASP